MTTTENNQQADTTASTSQEMPQSGPADTSAPADLANTLRREEAEASRRSIDKGEQPTAPPVPGTPRITRILPERQMSERQIPDTPTPAPAPPPAAQPSAQAGPSDPAVVRADLDWMPPAEDQVARFLNDVATIAPPPVRERDAGRVPGFVLPAATSPEAARRKKARAEPFWSQVVATPMEQPAPASMRRARRAPLPQTRWLVLGGAILLVIVGLAVVLFTHPGLLSRLHP